MEKRNMAKKASNFLNIWEVDTHFKCPVVGAVLSVEKHKTILKKSGIDISGLKSYEYHQLIMVSLSEKNSLSVKVNNYIRSRAKKWMDLVAGMSKKEIRCLWEENLESGQVGPLMYAIISWEETDTDLLQEVFGQVHMQAHANMTGIFNVRRNLTRMETTLSREKKRCQLKATENKKLVALRKQETARISALEIENARLKKQAAEFEHRFASQKKDPAALSVSKHQLQTMKTLLETRSCTLDRTEQKLNRLQVEYASLQKDNKALHLEIDSIISIFGEIAPPACQTDPDCKRQECSKYRLCAKRIFMIGGITKMKSHYKNIVEKAGGKFDYHDGYLKSAGPDIEAKVKASDLVLCPVNCNSHNACILVKKLCNQHNTQIGRAHV